MTASPVSYTHLDVYKRQEYSKAGVTAKVRLSKTEARLGTLLPKLPVVTFNDCLLYTSRCV